MHLKLQYSPEVKSARKNNKPIVALESTIITHGMPYPQNLECAKQVENCVREENAIPATIAIINGEVNIGLTSEQLDVIALPNTNNIKISRRDLSYALSTKKSGGTTVAATMFCAKLAGIKVFATGGIGGVHRGAETSFDISADLQELARTNVTVVCAGFKSILDLPLTLECFFTYKINNFR